MDQRRSNDRSGHRRHRALQGAGVALATVVAAGCFSYQPVDGPVPVQTETVRIQLTGAGQDAMMERRGLVLERFEGRVLSEAGDQLTVEARLPANRLAYGEGRDFVDTIQVDRPHVRTVDVKEFSTGRTVLAVGGGLAALAGIYAVVEAVVSSTEEGGTDSGGGVVISTVPWITTVLGWLR